MVMRLVPSYGAIAAATLLAACVLAAFGPADPAPGDVSGVQAVIDATGMTLVGDRTERSQRERGARVPAALHT